MLPPLKDGERNHAEQTKDADTADFEDALKSSAIKPADAKKAADAHHAMRERIAAATRIVTLEEGKEIKPPKPSPAPKDDKPLPDEFPSEFADILQNQISAVADRQDWRFASPRLSTMREPARVALPLHYRSQPRQGVLPGRDTHPR